MDVYDEADDVKWPDLIEGYPAWSSENIKPMKPLTPEEFMKRLRDQWEYECTHPKQQYLIMSRKEYEWWVEYLRMAEEERRITVASRAAQLL
jgi:hypothetical protein